jgi:hypothetical protein
MAWQVLIGSEFPDDMSELHLVQQINQVRCRHSPPLDYGRVYLDCW